MHWASTLPLVIVAVAVMVVPGGLIALLCRVRGLTAWALAPVVTTAVAAVGAAVTQLLGLRWGPLTFLLCVGVVAVVCGAVGALWLRRRGRSETHQSRSRRSGSTAHAALRRVWAPAALLVPAALIGYRFVRIFGAPDRLSQTWDNIFHQNALRFIVDTGRGSALTLGTLDQDSSVVSFYPAAWHDLAALLATTTGVDGAVATNVLNLVIAAVVWPAGCVLLTATIVGRRPAALVSAAVLSAAFGNFPYMLVQFGVLYPNFLALALLPAVLAVAVRTLGLHAEGAHRPVPHLVLTAFGGVALALSHPSVVLLLIAVLSPFVVVATARTLVTGRWPVYARALVAVGAVGGYGLVLVNAWSSLRPSDDASFWPPLGTPAQAWGEAITNAPVLRPLPLAVAALTVVGIAVIVRSRRPGGYCLLAAQAVVCWFYVVSAGYRKDELRSAITQIWYNDSYRTAAQLAVLAVPIAAIGAAGLLRWTRSRADALLERAPGRARQPVRVLSAVAAVVVLLVATNSEAVKYAQRAAIQSYAATPEAPLLSPDEAAVLHRVDDHVPADEKVLGVPGNGSALVYAVAGRRSVLMTAADKPTPTERVLFDHLQDVGKDPQVCAVAHQLQVGYVLDFGAREVNQATHDYPGFRNLSTNKGLRLVDASGPARLYEITACNS